MIVWHIGIIFLSFTAFFVAVVTGLLFLMQEGWLKRKDPRVLRCDMVPLEVLDRVNLWAVVIGFSLFSIGMIQALFLARAQWGSFWNADPMEVFSLITWGAYAFVLLLRLTAGLRGRRVVFMSVMSFLLVMFTCVGVNFITTRHVFFS